MKIQCLSCAAILLTGSQTNTASALSGPLDASNTNQIPSPDGRTLYYNATGDTPSYQLTSPEPAPITPVNSSSAIVDAFYKEIIGTANGTVLSDNCTKCIAGAELLHFAAMTQSASSFTELLIRICNGIPAVKKSIYAETCESQYSSTPSSSHTSFSNGAAGLGAYYAQLFSQMSITTGDFQAYCYNMWSVCTPPKTIGIDESLYFTAKPESANIAPSPSGESFNVLHLSDWHLDPRYDIGSEANCTGSLCCRPYATNPSLHTTSQNPSLPASRFGSLLCDTPADLALSAFHSMPQFFNLSDVSFSIFTGDIVSHDKDDQISQEYVKFEEETSFRIFKAALGNIPVYATLGNHDSLPQGQNTPNSLAGSGSSNTFGWNYELLSSLWQNSSWLSPDAASFAATHYAAYAYTTPQNLRIISLNTDFWYKLNIFNYYNTTNPDSSGLLTFLANELATAEHNSQRVWIIGHVTSGYEGTQPLPNPTALFYSLVVRYSPATIAGIYFGHSHKQQTQIFYDFLPNSTYTDPTTGKLLRNTSLVDYSRPLNTGLMGPSIVPLTNLNAGYTLYQIDAATFSLTNAQTYIANISNSLSASWDDGPIWEFEYDTRAAYTNTNTSSSSSSSSWWPTDAPLNATFWHRVTERMLADPGVAQMYSLYETKSSVKTPRCDDGECARRQVCYMRSGSAELGRRCPSAPAA